MPTYEYRCKDCGHQFEEFQSMSADPIDTCPECGGRAERVISGGAGFLFKGSGFYITDYRSDNYKKAAASDKPSPVSSTKSESKTEKPKTKSKDNVKKSA